MNPLYLPYNRWMATVKACSSVSILSSYEDRKDRSPSDLPSLAATKMEGRLITGTGSTYGSIDTSCIEGWTLLPLALHSGPTTHLLDRHREWKEDVVARGDYAGVLVKHNRHSYVMTDSVDICAYLPEPHVAASMEEAVRYEDAGGGGGCWRAELGKPVDMFMFNGYAVSRFYYARHERYCLRTYWRAAGRVSHLHVKDLDALWERTIMHRQPALATPGCHQAAVQLALF